MKQRNIAILGSTGSIGTQALDVIKKNKSSFNVEVLTANNNADLLIEQAKLFNPNIVVIANESLYSKVQDALSATDIKVYAGAEAISQVVEMDTIDVVLTAMVGFSGLQATVNALKAKKAIALANKETLVVAGDIITELSRKNNAPILPVDSEHSAIFQCLAGEQHNPIEKIYLTASGGPFRGFSRKQLEDVTLSQALNHPNWEMGSKITIDSASMMNKGFEAIEAKWLFGLEPSQIDVIVHPQSIVHSIVQFTDSSMKAQMGLPDMRLPIQYALAFPQRLKSDFPRFNFADFANLTFESPDFKVFKNLQLAFDAMNLGGNVPCVLNAANEVLVEAFLKEKISFVEMPEIIEKVIEKVPFVKSPSLDDYFECNDITREITSEFIRD